MALKRFYNFWDAAIGAIAFSGTDMSGLGTAFGNGAAAPGQDPQNAGLSMSDTGNIYTEVHPATGAGVLNPASTAADVVMSVVTIPGTAIAQAMDQAGRGVLVNCNFLLGSNVNSKRVKIIANPTTAVIGQAVTGGTTIADSGAITTAASSGGCTIGAQIYKYGAAGSNTQVAIHQASQSGNLAGSLLAPQNLTLNEQGNIVLAITGNAATAATDIALVLVNVDGNN